MSHFEYSQTLKTSARRVHTVTETLKRDVHETSTKVAQPIGNLSGPSKAVVHALAKALKELPHSTRTSAILPTAALKSIQDFPEQARTHMDALHEEADRAGLSRAKVEDMPDDGFELFASAVDQHNAVVQSAIDKFSQLEAAVLASSAIANA